MYISLWYSTQNSYKRFAYINTISSAENTTGTVFKSKDIVAVNYDGNDDKNGWRRAQILSIDKAVFFYIFMLLF